VLREVAAGTLAAVPLDTDQLVRPLGIIHRRGTELNSTTRRFIELLKAEAGGKGWDAKRVDGNGSSVTAGEAEEVELLAAASVGNGHATVGTHAGGKRSGGSRSSSMKGR
jgi:hypothetical protein